MNGKGWYDYTTRTLADDGLPRRQAYKFGWMAGAGIAVAALVDYIQAASSGRYDSIVVLTLERAVFVWFGLGLILESCSVPFFEATAVWPVNFVWKRLRRWIVP